MLLLILITEYLLGEIAFLLLDGYYGLIDLNIIYYAVVSIIDALVCSYVIRIDNKRYFYYAISSIALAFIHTYGLAVYSFDKSPLYYESLILIALMIKLMIAVIPDGDSSLHSLRNLWRDLVYRCNIACATRICWVCL